MAQHDYVIDNSTGANVRADINSALQAIVTNNSGSSAPSSTFPFMLFADSAAGTMKIRNAADNAFIELFQLDGTFTLEDGSASTPALAFRDDLNTGIFSSAADTFNVATGGVERMELGATTIFNEDGADVDFRIEGDTEANLFYVDAGNNRIGIGTASPSTPLHVSDSQSSGGVGFTLQNSTGSAGTTPYCFIGGILNPSRNGGEIRFGREGVYAEQATADSFMAFYTAQNDTNTERLRIDSSGNVGIGTTSPEDLLHIKSGKIRIENAIVSNNDSTISYDNTDFLIDVDPNNARGSSQFQIKVDAAAAFTINDNRKVGIGTTSPETLQHNRVNTFNDDINKVALTLSNLQTSGVHQYFQNGSTGSGVANGTRIGLGNVDEFFIQQLEAKPIVFSTDGSERMTINSGGEVGIGKTATVGVKLDVTTPGNAHAARVNNSNAGFANLICDNDAGSGTRNFISFRINNSEKGTITSNGSTTAFNTSSDYRLKENVTAISDGITRLKTLKPSRFNFIADAEKTVDGFLAHEVTAVPEAITGTKDEIATEDNNGLGIKKGDPIYQSIDQSKLVPLLVAAVQELIGKVEALEAA